MAHANAVLTERARLRLARLIIDDQWPVARAAERFQVSWPTAKRWADRYVELGEAGMVDRSSRPHHSPRATPAPVLRKIVHLRWKQRLGPVGIAAILGLSTSTVHRILVTCRISRLSCVPGSPPAASSSARSCPTTDRATARTCGATRAPSSGSSTAGPAPTGRRPTGKSSGSTAPWSRAGRSAGSTSASRTAERPYRAGSTSTTITDPTPHAEATHPSPG